MLRVIDILPHGDWPAAEAIDRVTLDHDERHRRRFRFTGERGTDFLLDRAAAVVLADGDGLRLDDGSLVAVQAAPEPLMEVTADTPARLLRLAWHVGNRHLAADIGATRIRLRHDHVVAEMLRGLGASVTAIDAPFTPERGAYGQQEAHGHHH